MDNKSKLIMFIILIVIVGSIGYQFVMKYISGINMAKMMGMPTKVETAVVENRMIYDNIEYVGRIEAKREVQLVSRVNGWLQKQFYNDGDIVKKGQLLLQIEPDEYALAVKNAAAALRQAEVTLSNAGIELHRAKELVKGDYVSRSYYDQAYTKYETDRANVEAAKASLERAKLNLSYTKIYAPFEGKIGELQIHEGNYVTAQTGELANLVSIDPIYASFTAKQKDLRRLQISEDNTKLPDVKVSIKLEDGTLYDEEGILDFVDNKIDKNLGTIALRATFDNKNKKLIPNDFVKVVLTSKTEKEVALVPQSAVLESVNGKYVWIIDEKGCAKQQDIEIVAPYKEFWILQDGLKAGDKVISSNLQTMRQGVKVEEVQVSEEIKAQKELAKKEATEYSMTEKPNKKNADNKVAE